jgi:hypothetical protein
MKQYAPLQTANFKPIKWQNYAKKTSLLHMATHETVIIHYCNFVHHKEASNARKRKMKFTKYTLRNHMGLYTLYVTDYHATSVY